MPNLNQPYYTVAGIRMIRKIISWPQTGADRAALDVAIKMGIPHGGWVPKGRIAEDGPIPAKYELQEMPTESYEARTEQNVIDSDGTLIMSHGPLTGGSAYTLKMAKKHQKPCLHVNLNRKKPSKVMASIHKWLEDKGIEVLNVAGPRLSKDPEIHAAVVTILEGVYWRFEVRANYPEFIRRLQE